MPVANLKVPQGTARRRPLIAQTERHRVRAMTFPGIAAGQPRTRARKERPEQAQDEPARRVYERAT